MTSPRFATILAALALFAPGPFLSCSSEPQRSAAAEAAAEAAPEAARERVDVGLASVLLPPGEWKISRTNPAHVQFGMRGDRPGESLLGLILLSKLQPFPSEAEFAEFVRAQRNRDAPDPRYEDLLREEGASTEEGAFVYRFHVRFKDHGSPHIPSGADHLVVEDFGAVFQHPLVAGVAVHVTLSHRARPGDELSGFEAIAKELLDSVEFHPVPAAADAGSGA